MTAIVIITSGVFKSEAMRGAAMTQAGFAQALGGMGEKFVAIGLFFLLLQHLSAGTTLVK